MKSKLVNGGGKGPWGRRQAWPIPKVHASMHGSEWVLQLLKGAEMNRGVAETIAILARQIDQTLGQIILTLDDEPDESIRDTLQRATYDLVGDMHENLVLPIATQFPDLHPDDPERFRAALEKMKGRN